MKKLSILTLVSLMTVGVLTGCIIVSDDDGDAGGTGDGDGDSCGWADIGGGNSGYACGGTGEDPEMSFPLACPVDLVEGADCDSTGAEGIGGVGCCDTRGNNWYCSESGMLFKDVCAG